jgi:hypothetical protein
MKSNHFSRESCETLNNSSILSENDDYHALQLPEFLNEKNQILPNQLQSFSHSPESFIKFENTTESFCPSLDSPVNLWSYLSSNVTKTPPSLRINIKGTHVEMGSDNIILDFDFTLDLSALIDSEWTRMINLDETRSWKTVMEEYTQTLQWFKR